MIISSIDRYICHNPKEDDIVILLFLYDRPQFLKLSGKTVLLSVLLPHQIQDSFVNLQSFTWASTFLHNRKVATLQTVRSLRSASKKPKMNRMCRSVWLYPRHPSVCVLFRGGVSAADLVVIFFITLYKVYWPKRTISLCVHGKNWLILLILTCFWMIAFAQPLWFLSKIMSKLFKKQTPCGRHVCSD